MWRQKQRNGGRIDEKKGEILTMRPEDEKPFPKNIQSTHLNKNMFLISTN